MTRWYQAAALFAAGVAMTGWLVAHFGAAGVAATLSAVGWSGLLAISGFHLIGTALMGLAWWGLRRRGKRLRFIWGRLVRDAGSELLPLSQIGGSLMGTRAVIAQGEAGAGVIAATVVDMTMEFCAQIAFVALGAILLLSLFHRSTLIAPLVLALSVATAAAVAFIIVQHRGSDLLMRLATRLARRQSTPASAASVGAEIRGIYGSKPSLYRSFLLHLGAWIVAGIEAWLALRLMGANTSLAVVLGLESLLYATRGFAFLVPAAIGVQEGAYVAFGVALGLTPELALGLSLLKRGRDLVLGLPALASWPVLEHRRWRERAIPE